MKHSAKLISVLAGITMGLGAAQAASESYYLTENNSGLADANFALVTLQDVGSDIGVTVEINQAAFPGGYDNFGMQEFWMNFDASLNLSSLNFSNYNPSDWEVTVNEDSLNAGGGYGKFDLKFVGDQPGQDRTNTLSFLISAEGDTLSSYTMLSDEGYMFAAHVGGFGDGELSTKIAGGTPVPVPAAMWLFGTGLLALAGFNRRRKNA